MEVCLHDFCLSVCFYELSRDWFSTSRHSIRPQRSWASGKLGSKLLTLEDIRSPVACGKITMQRSWFPSHVKKSVLLCKFSLLCFALGRLINILTRMELSIDLTNSRNIFAVLFLVIELWLRAFNFYFLHFLEVFIRKNIYYTSIIIYRHLIYSWGYTMLE